MAKLGKKDYDLSDPKQCNKYWTKTAEKLLLGRKIVKVEYMSDKECNDYMWYKKPITFILDDHTRIIAMQDDEGNDGGVLTCLTTLGGEEVLPVLSVEDK
tara:strand:+ start:1576 stop:1875 length:300 start_codon:yes stop_codon:yes gene_type:complete